jgi:hypothetical protein
MINKFNRDILYKIVLRSVDECSQFCLVNANDEDDIFLILNDDEVLI